MKYSILANATALTHITLILIVLIGLLMCFRHKRFRPWEAGFLLIVVVLWSYYGNCPLTILEQHFRDLAGQSTNLTSIGFLPYYAEKFLNIGLESKTIVRSTYFMGGMFFLASVEWISPYVNFEIFKLRRSLKKLTKKRRLGLFRP